MLDPRLIRENPDAIREMLSNRRAIWPMEEAQALDAKRRELLNEVESLKAMRNEGSRKVAAMKKDDPEKDALMDSLRNAGTRNAPVQVRIIPVVQR